MRTAGYAQQASDLHELREEARRALSHGRFGHFEALNGEHAAVLRRYNKAPYTDLERAVAQFRNFISVMSTQ